MPKRLAITIAGAVSLGSYEAGVLYEVITALGAHNDALPVNDAARIEIDVITGASAGGITAALGVQKLLFERTALIDPKDNALYNPWVKDAILDNLLQLQSGEDVTHSILSSNYMESISKKYITQRYQSHLLPPALPHSAGAKNIWLGLALSNLNGVDYTRPTYAKGAFSYTDYQDEIKRQFTSADDKENIWEIFRAAAVACGAFPFAFRTQDLPRHQDEYGDSPYLTPWSAPVRTFTYTDGGVFQNEPLGMAKTIVDQVDHHLDNDNRFYLFVAPGARGSTSSLDFNSQIANFGSTAKQLVMTIFQQARFHDWIRAEEINEKVDLFNTRALELHTSFMDFIAVPRGPNAIDPAGLATGAKLLLPPLFGGDAVKQGEAWHRLQNQFQKEYKVLVNANGGATLVADTWLDSILAFETAANLGAKDEMVIYGITAFETELASGKLEAFQGFFDILYRDHDYNVGRQKARQLLTTLVDGLGPINYRPVDIIPPPDPALDNLPMKNVDLNERQRVKDRLTSNAHALMLEIGIPTAIIREAIDLAFISPALKKLLAL